MSLEKLSTLEVWQLSQLSSRRTAGSVALSLVTPSAEEWHVL